jgi:hypothetical protein
MPMLTIKEAATEHWLVENPVDETGVPFYVPMGSRWKFEQRDIEPGSHAHAGERSPWA